MKITDDIVQGTNLGPRVEFEKDTDRIVLVVRDGEYRIGLTGDGGLDVNYVGRRLNRISVTPCAGNAIEIRPHE